LPDYRVNLDVFAGPLDLLLYLVRKEEVDIYDIPLAKITDQYIRYIEILKNLDIDLAGDFLVMAATLMHIKSAMLLPKADTEDLDADDLDDPRAELIRQLLEYKKFKDAANLLSDSADQQKTRFPRPDSIIQTLKTSEEPELDLENVSVWDLLEAFDAILKATGSAIDISHIADDTPIDLYQIEILDRLQNEGPMNFEKIFEGKKNRLVLVGLFLALLELVREKLVKIDHPRRENLLLLTALTDEPAAEAVQKAILSNIEESQPAPRTSPSATPAVPIVELPPKSQSADSAAGLPDQDLSVPIAEIPPAKKSPQSAEEDNSLPAEKTESR